MYHQFFYFGFLNIVRRCAEERGLCTTDESFYDSLSGAGKDIYFRRWGVRGEDQNFSYAF